MFRHVNPTPSSSHAHRVRTLSMENLESRLVLSGIPEMATVAPPLPTAVPTDEPVSVASIGSVVDATSISTADLASAATNVGLIPSVGTNGLEPPVSNLVPIPVQPGGGVAPRIAPWITDFTASLENGKWHFRGSVLDDANPAGLTVYFAGILFGQTTTDENGHFDFAVPDSGVGIGWVYAHTIDRDGQVSDCAMAIMDV